MNNALSLVGVIAFMAFAGVICIELIHGGHWITGAAIFLLVLCSIRIGKSK
jgi:hypothetical protein